MHLVSHETPTFRHKNVNIIVNQGVQKLSCSRQSIKLLFEKLCPTVNYGTERYIFSHKSVALSAVVRCKFSFYFFWKILHTPGFCLQKHVWTQKKICFSKTWNFWSFCCKHTEQNIWKLIQNTKLHELCAVMKGMDDISFISPVHFTLVGCRETYTFLALQKSSTQIRFWRHDFGVRFFFPCSNSV